MFVLPFGPISHHKSGGRSSSATSSRALPESCGSQSSEWEERKKSRAKRGSFCTRRGSRKTSLRVVEPVYHQTLLRGRSRRSRARRRLWRRRESNAAGAHVLFNLVSCPPRLSQGLFLLHAREQLFFLTLGFHTVLLSSSTCDGLLFQDFSTTCSARGLVAVFTEKGAHGTLDRDRRSCAAGRGGDP